MLYNANLSQIKVLLDHFIETEFKFIKMEVASIFHFSGIVKFSKDKFK